MHQQRAGARAEYREQQSQRVKNSPRLSEKYQHLKSLSAELAYLGPEGLSKISEIKYTVNIENAKSVFRFPCPNPECIAGDFDLTAALAKAVAQENTRVTGELLCEGWRSKTVVDSVRCHNILRYKLSLGY